MGKMVTLMSLLIFVDLLFIITGQITGSLSSVIFAALLNIKDATFTDFFILLIGDGLNLFNSATGIASLLATSGIIIGAFVLTREFKVLMIPITFTLALMAGDFIAIFVYLSGINFVLASIIMIPLILIYYFVVVEWLRGKD